MPTNLMKDVLKLYGIPEEVLERYNEEHRFYHNLDHITSMVDSAIKKGIHSNELILAIIFHDIIYDPKASDNEEKSAEFFYDHFQNYVVFNAILETKSHKAYSDLGKQLCELDLEILSKDFETFVDFENKIFKEYQWVDYKIYKEKRVEILTMLGVNPQWVEYVKYRKPNIGLYVGSFNPFHVGHLNVLQKAEQIFDKVIIARGVNSDKKNEIVDLPSRIKYRQTEQYDGLLTDFIDNLGYDVTLIRGLRNSVDLQYEMTQYRFLQDLKPDLKMVSIFCDKEFEHVSSSAIRTLEKYGKQNKYLTKS